MTNSKDRRRIAVLASVLALVGITGGAIAAGVWQTQPADSRSEAVSQVRDTQTVLVKVVRVSDMTRPVATQTFTGKLVGRYDSNLAFRVSGKITARHVEVGQRVKQGDLLYELETNDLELQLATALANEKAADAAVQQAQQEERRLYTLRKENAVSQSDYDSVRLLLDSSLAKQTAATKQTELAERQLAYSKLIADDDGIVLSIDAEVGQIVKAGDAILRFVKSNEVEVEVSLPEQFLSMAAIEYGDITFWTQPDRTFKARLRELSPTADEMARLFRARFSLIDSVMPPDRDGESWAIQGVPIKLGMTVNVSFGNASESDTIAIPSTAISHLNDEPIVWALVEPQTSAAESVSGQVYSLEAVKVDVQRFDAAAVHVSAEPIAARTIVAAGVHKLTGDSKVRVWTK